MDTVVCRQASPSIANASHRSPVRPQLTRETKGVGGWDLTLAAVPKEGLGLLLCRVQGRTAKNSKINPHILVRRCMIFDPWLIVALYRVLYLALPA